MIKFDCYIVEDEEDLHSDIYVDVCGFHEKIISRQSDNKLEKDEVLPAMGETYVDCSVFGCQSDHAYEPSRAEVRLIIKKDYQRLFKFV